MMKVKSVSPICNNRLYIAQCGILAQKASALFFALKQLFAELNDNRSIMYRPIRFEAYYFCNSDSHILFVKLDLEVMEWAAENVE